MRGIIGLLFIVMGIALAFGIITGTNPVQTAITSVTSGGGTTHGGTSGGKPGEGVLPPRNQGGGNNQQGANT